MSYQITYDGDPDSYTNFDYSIEQRVNQSDLLRLSLESEPFGRDISKSITIAVSLQNYPQVQSIKVNTSLVYREC